MFSSIIVKLADVSFLEMSADLLLGDSPDIIVDMSTESASFVVTVLPVPNLSCLFLTAPSFCSSSTEN